MGSPSKVKAQWLVAAPKALQTGFAALGDWYNWRLAEKLYGQNSAISWSVVSMFNRKTYMALKC